MKIKVCGMKNPDNIEQLGKLPIDFIGFIFFAKSPRYAAGLDITDLSSLPDSIKRVGVFVNEDFATITQLIQKYKLTHIQLHGQESTEFCLKCRQNEEIKVIKAFNVSEETDLERTKEYVSVCDYFLFDTKTSQHGGSGIKFDWNILKAYQEKVPFFLSGGISESDAANICDLSLPGLYALDLNSKFEIEPGLKNINTLNNFISHFKKI